MNTVDLDRLGQAMAEGRSLLGASTGTDFHPYGRLEAEEHALLAASGLDEEAYNALWLETMLSERESPPPGGTYYVGFSWDSGRAGAEIDLGWGAYVTHRPAELYGQSYRAVDGALQRTEAVELTPVDGGASFDPYDWPPGAYPNHRSFYAGAMAAGETRWYHQPLVFDEALAVQATLVRGKDAAVDAGTFSVAIYDEDGALLGEPYLSDPTATVSASDQQVTAGVSMAFTGEGEVPYATEAGAWLAVTWNSPIEEAAEVRLVVDVIPRFEGVTPAFRPPVEPGPDAGESAQDETLVVADDPVETNPGGFPVLIVGAVIGLGVLVGGGSWWRRRAVGRG